MNLAVSRKSEVLILLWNMFQLLYPSGGVRACADSQERGCQGSGAESAALRQTARPFEQSRLLRTHGAVVEGGHGWQEQRAGSEHHNDVAVEEAAALFFPSRQQPAVYKCK